MASGFWLWVWLLPAIPVRRGKRDGYNPAGAAHKDVRRFRSSRMLHTKIPGPLADPTVSSLGAP